VDSLLCARLSSLRKSAKDQATLDETPVRLIWNQCLQDEISGLDRFSTTVNAESIIVGTRWNRRTGIGIGHPTSMESLPRSPTQINHSIIHVAIHLEFMSHPSEMIARRSPMRRTPSSSGHPEEFYDQWSTLGDSS
jgi:hypothetical protein